MSDNLIIPYSAGGSSYRSQWVRIEQIMPKEAKANVADVYHAWLAAASGQSAQKMRPDGCPVEFDGEKIIAYLGFYFWPSHPNLPFSISTTLGEIGRRRNVRAIRSFSAFVNNTNRYALPYYMSEVVVTFETPLYSEFGEQLSGVTDYLIIDGIWVVFSRAIFGAIRISGIAFGVSVVLELTFQKGLEFTDTSPEDWEDWMRGPNGEIVINALPDKKATSEIISDINIAISVSFPTQGGYSEDSVLNGDVESTSLTFEQNSVTIPECLTAVLSFCPDAFDPFGLLTTFCEQITDMDFYYNACNGDPLGSRDKGNGRSYCQKLETISETSPWLPVEGK